MLFNFHTSSLFWFLFLLISCYFLCFLMGFAGNFCHFSADLNYWAISFAMILVNGYFVAKDGFSLGYF